MSLRLRDLDSRTWICLFGDFFYGFYRGKSPLITIWGIWFFQPP